MGTPFLVCALTVGLFVMGKVNAQEKSTPTPCQSPFKNSRASVSAIVMKDRSLSPP